MSKRLDDIIDRIQAERQRQLDLPGSEWDARNSPGDWIALIGHYVHEEVRRNGVVPNRNDFEETLIKASAVILAALENIPNMVDRKELE